jgi:hypothetical protein
MLIEEAPAFGHGRRVTFGKPPAFINERSVSFDERPVVIGGRSVIVGVRRVLVGGEWDGSFRCGGIERERRCSYFRDVFPSLSFNRYCYGCLPPQSAHDAQGYAGAFR